MIYRWLWLLPLMSTASAAAENPTNIPDLPSANLQVNWADFKTLLKQIQPPPRKEETPPPLPWVLNSAVYRAEVMPGNSLRVEATYNLHVWAKGWNMIPLLGNVVALESVVLDDQPSFLTSQEDRFALLTDLPGLHVLKAVFHAVCTEKEGEVSMLIPCAKSSATHMELLLNIPEAEVSAPAAANISTKPMEGRLLATLAFRTADDLEVHWRLPARALPPAPPKEPPRITCEQSTLATVSESVIACQSRLQLDVLRGETSQFTLRLPATAQVIRVEGAGLDWQGTTEGETQTLSIKLNHAVTDHYELNLAYETAIAEKAAAIVLPRLSVSGIARQAGVLAVAIRGAVAVECSEASEGLRRLDTNELPAGLRMQSAEPILHAFVLDDQPALPVFAFRRLEQLPVRVAGIDEAHYESLITGQGLMVTHATYLVRNNLKQFLRVSLGPESQVWSATVQGREVRPAREGEDKAGVLLVPLVKSNEAGRAVDTFAVELYYVQPIDPANGWWDALTLRTPLLDIAANRVSWEVLLPESRRVYSAAGDLSPAECFAPFPQAAGFAPRTGPATTTAPGQSTEVLRRLRDGMEHMPKNAPAPTRAPAAAPTVVAPTAVQGLSPIHMELPRTGVSHCFNRVIAPENTPLRITLKVYDARLMAGGLWLLKLGAVLLGFLAVRRIWLGQHRRSPANTVVLFVVLLLLAHATNLPLITLAGWAAIGALLAAGWQWRQGLAATPAV